jgi:hypothetical protein
MVKEYLEARDCYVRAAKRSQKKLQELGLDNAAKEL